MASNAVMLCTVHYQVLVPDISSICCNYTAQETKEAVMSQPETPAAAVCLAKIVRDYRFLTPGKMQTKIDSDAMLINEVAKC